MNRIIGALLLMAASFGTQIIYAQDFKGLLGNAEKKLGDAEKKLGVNNNNNGNGGSGSAQNNSFANISNTDATSALREALQVGAKNASGRLSAPNGFLGNAAIKILMPPEAREAENTLREVGMGSQVDKAIVAMNRAAEDASSKATPIFVNAIKNMSINDGLSILKGGKGAATAFLRASTTVALTAAFKPVIQASLAKVNATKYWANVFNAYNRLPLIDHKVNPDLAAYVTERALNGLFVAIAEEEDKIRTDPAAQVTSILQKVFGGH